MSPTFACGMPNPWTPPLALMAIEGPRCEHCFCVEEAVHFGYGKHLHCCKCKTVMAEKFVKAWFEILATRSTEEPAK